MRSYIFFLVLFITYSSSYSADKSIQYFNTSVIGLPTTSAVNILLPKETATTSPPLAVRLDTYKEIYFGAMIYYDKTLGFEFIRDSISKKYSIDFATGSMPGFAHGESKDRKTHCQVLVKQNTIVVLIMNYDTTMKKIAAQ